MSRTIEVDYLVVGAGAAGMAFTDALVNHSDATVALVDRRHSAGGHWLSDYPFVRLHQASAFYGVASTLLGNARVQTDGPEAGLHERASAAEICDYYARVLQAMTATGRVSFYPNCEYLGDGCFRSRLAGTTYQLARGGRVVDARYLSPDIPALTPPPFTVASGSHVIPVNDVVAIADSPDRFVVVGSGKTATDATLYLLENGVEPDRICWVRPRDPWMLNRAVVQPDPTVFIGMGADLMAAAAAADSPDDLFLRLEAAGIMLRIDPSVTPTMAKTPTLAQWELDGLRTIENVVRLGHIRGVAPGVVSCADGDVAVPERTTVIHCAASGLQYPGLVPIWQRKAITLQPVRTGFPCFGAAIIGFVEAIMDGDGEKNRVCRPSPYSNTPQDWAAMQVLGARSSAAFSAVPEIKAFADSTAINPGRVPAERAADPEVVEAMRRLQQHQPAGMARLAELAGLA
ncbi:NAD(P)-binding protein [Smaragdicoccus niigatensis]|uniref:NAD(P)-binding protein n=1 Tax=Smaragdicoccus niigatensis TaxID=359359 RepID=UPI00035E1B9F|nr:NAD(P)-binding protein [Smaragdicoccus niigatensis]